MKPIKSDRDDVGAVDVMTPRICMPTARSLSRMAFQCAKYEAQDILVESDEVDLIQLRAGRGFQFKEKWQRRLLYRDLSGKLAQANPGVEPVRLTKRYDLFLVVCQTYWDLFYVNAIEGWKDHCKTSLCWIDELFAAAVPSYKHWLPSLNRFDHVVLGMAGSVDVVSKAVGKRCHHVAAAVDAFRFSPYPNLPERVVDIYSVGRRVDRVHRVLRQLSEGGNSFYIFDTLRGGETPVSDYAQHRELYANIAKRSRYFMVAPGKMNVADETQGQIEVGFRYFEGAAAGAVLLGQAPACEPFRQMFDWPDAVVEISTDGSDVAEIMQSLNAQPERLREISRRNAVEALRRHDWIYRWKQILNIAGLELLPAAVAREKRLHELAEAVVRA